MSNKEIKLQTGSTKMSNSLEVVGKKGLKPLVLSCITCTGTALDKVLAKTITDLVSTSFPKTPIVHIQGAMLKGISGEYGKTFKLNAQEVCIWIREYLKTAIPINVDDMFFMVKGVTIEEYCDKSNEVLIKHWMSREGTTDRDMAVGQLEFEDRLCTPKNVREAQNKVFEVLYENK